MHPVMKGGEALRLCLAEEGRLRYTYYLAQTRIREEKSF